MLLLKREFWFNDVVFLVLFVLWLLMFGVCFFRYVDQFSRCLYVEYKDKGIDVQCQVILNLV